MNIKWITFKGSAFTQIISFIAPLGKAMTHDMHNDVREDFEILIVARWRFAAPLLGQINDEPLIVHTGSGTAPTRFPLYFVPSFMRAVKEHQVQQESASDKWHLLLVSVSVRQTDAISLLTGLYEPDISISSQVSHVIFHCTPRNKQNKAQILIYYLTCRQLKVLFSVFFKDQTYKNYISKVVYKSVPIRSFLILRKSFWKSSNFIWEAWKRSWGSGRG